MRRQPSGQCHCGEPITRGVVSYRRNRHCSHACKSAAVRKIRPGELREAAERGLTSIAMAQRFGVHRDTVMKWLDRDHLYMLWWSVRYAFPGP